MSDCFGRWTCSNCDNLNYPWYEECVICKCPKPECDKDERIQK